MKFRLYWKPRLIVMQYLIPKPDPTPEIKGLWVTVVGRVQHVVPSIENVTWEPLSKCDPCGILSI